jgi:hypothetical protein
MKINLDALARDAAAVYAETYKDRDGHPREPAFDSSKHIHNSIWMAVAGLLRNTDIKQATFSATIYRELVSAVRYYAAMMPLRDLDGTVYEHFFMPKDIPERDSYDFNRLWKHLLEQEFLWLLDALNHTRTQRHLLLVQLFAHREPDATSPVLAHLELIDRKIVNLRERITSFCAEHPQLMRNPLIPPLDTSRDEPTFKQAIGYDQRKHDFLEIFQPSPPEEILLPDLPDFREREWHLFHFTFSSDTPSSDNNREDICMNGDQVFDEDIRLLHHRLIERKMLLAYTILVQMIHETREIGFRVEQNIWYLPFQALCDDIHRLRVAHLRATIWDDEDDDEQLPPSWIEAELLVEYGEIAHIKWVLKWYQTQLSHMDSLSVLVSEAYSLATQFVKGYEWILENETFSPQQKQEKVATLRASLNTKFKVCLRLLWEQQDERADELQDDPLFVQIADIIDDLSVYLNTDGHISE